MNIKRFIYMSKFYLRFFFMFLLPILPALIILELMCLGIRLIPDKLADAVFNMMKIDYKDRESIKILEKQKLPFEPLFSI